MSPVVKRKGEKFTIPSKYLLFVLTCLCTILMVVTISTNLLNKPINTAMGYIIVPFQQGVSKVGGWFSRRSDELIQIKDLLAENQKLKEQVDELVVENTLLQQDKAELVRLHELYEIEIKRNKSGKVKHEKE